MGKFQEDVKLLGDIQALIEEQRKTAEMSPATQMIVGKVLPGVKGMIPEAREKAVRTISVLEAAKNRLAELMEEANK